MNPEKYKSVLRTFFNEVQERLPNGVGMGAALADLLGKSENTVYRKVRGEISIPMEEYISIAQHFGVQLPLFDDSGSVGFHQVLRLNDPKSASKELKEMAKWLSEVSVKPDRHLFLCSPSLSILHLLSRNSLQALAAMLLMGTGRFQNLEEMQRRIRVPYDLYSGFDQIGLIFNSCSITDFINDSSLDLILSAIDSAVRREWMRTEDAKGFLNELGEQLLRLEKSAAEGSHKVGQSFKLYMPTEFESQGLWLRYNDERLESVLMQSGRSTFMESDNDTFREEAHSQIKTQLESSILISQSGKAPRTVLFCNLQKRIKDMMSNY